MSIRRISLIAAALVILSLTAHPSFAADKLRIGYSGATITNSMLWVTQEGRLFEKNGIDAEVLYLQTTLGQTALIAGEIQMCVYSASLLTPARLQGADVVMLLSFLHKPIYRLVVKPEIRSVADLRGKRVGVTRFGTVSDWTTRLLSRLGLDAEKDVVLVQSGDVPVLVNSLAVGKSIDAAIMQPPYDKKLAAMGLRVLLNMQEMDIVLQQTGLNTTQKFIARNPDIVRRVVKSMIDGIHFMRNNPPPPNAPSANTCRSKTSATWKIPINCCAVSSNPSLTRISKASNRSSKKPANVCPRPRPPMRRILWTRVSSRSWTSRDISTGCINELPAIPQGSR